MEYDDPSSEPARVRAAQAGDAAALEELLEAYLPLVHAIASRALDHHVDAEDVTQETMVRAVTHLSDLRDPDRFRPWLVAIAVRQIRERSRRARRRGPEVSLESLLDHPVADQDVAEQVAFDVDGAVQREVVDRAVQWLEPDERQILALWQLELDGSISRDDVAGGLGITRTHAAVRVHRLKVRLEEAREIVAALDQQPGCPQLHRITRGWDGTTNSVWRKRLNRHVRGCEVCAAASKSSIPVDRLLAGAVLVPVPATLAIDAVHVSAHAPSVTASGFFQQIAAALTAKPAAVVGTVAAGSALAVGATILPTTNWGPGTPDPPSRAAAGPIPSTTVPAGLAPTTTTAATSTTTPTTTGTTVFAYGRVIYVAPDGDDAGPGSAKEPLRSVAKALKVVEPGQTITLRGGVYRPTKPLVAKTSGTAKQPITLTVAAGETAVLDGGELAPSSTLFELKADRWTVSGLEVRGAPAFGIVCRSCSHSTFENLDVHANGLSGMLLTGDGAAANLVQDSDFHDNHDNVTLGENADGLEIANGSGDGNVVRGVRVFHNADDGLSTWNFRSPVRMESTWSFGNGYNRWDVPGDWAGNGVGFKLGGAEAPVPEVAHVVVNCAAWDNVGFGFSANRNLGALDLKRNTSYRNHNSGFWVTGDDAVVTRNVSVSDSAGVDIAAVVASDLNSWQGRAPNTTEFVSTDAAVAEGPRARDGGLPASSFLIPTKTHAGASMSLVPFPDS